MGSGNFSLSAEDVKKILKGAVLVSGGVLVTYVADQLQLIDQSNVTGAMIVAVVSVGLNVARKWLVDNGAK